ncbi:MAG TPA: HEAT repeat domain-containing protein [Geobacter anodireducens]|nr:HEAT repeat domain-containing protein [Geobacter anodireducens]
MTDTNSDIRIAGIEPGILSSFIIELNILRRAVSAYPKGHPAIRSAAEKVAGQTDLLLAGEERATVGIARDTILFAGHPLDRRNLVFRDLARFLSERGLTLLTVKRGVSADELIRFCTLLGLRRDEIRQRGGLGRLMSEDAILGLEVTGLDYGLFHVTEDERIAAPAADQDDLSLWERYVRGMLDGTLDPFGTVTGHHGTLAPEELARLMNGCLGGAAESRQKSYDAVITAFLRNVREAEQGPGCDESQTARLAELAELLTPELRRQFLGSAFAALARHPAMAERVAAALSDGAVMEAFTGLTERGSSIPPVLLDLFQRFGLADPSPAAGAAPPSHPAGATEMARRLETVLREGDSRSFVPQPYEDDLSRLTRAGAQRVVLPELEPLRLELESENAAVKAGEVIMEIIRLEPGGADPFASNLAELAEYYLATGDFGSLGGLFLRIHVLEKAGAGAALREAIGAPAFVAALIDAPAIWGKVRHGEIRQIISQIGPPCVTPLLDRLAVEESMTLRRWYMDCLVGLGAAAGAAAVALLEDGRWYFVRNLLVLLRQLDYSAGAASARKLLAHPHPKVRQEAARTLLGFRDPQAEQWLLRGLESSDRGTLLMAVPLVDGNASRRVRAQVIELLRRGGAAADPEVRCATVRALAETGDPAALPELARILGSRSLLRAAALNQVKLEVVRSLPRFPGQEPLRLLREAAAAVGGEIAGAARAALRLAEARDR